MACSKLKLLLSGFAVIALLLASPGLSVSCAFADDEPVKAEADSDDTHNDDTQNGHTHSKGDNHEPHSTDVHGNSKHSDNSKLSNGADHSDGHDAHGHGADYDPLSTSELFKHVQDSTYFHVPKFMDFFDGTADGHVNIPQPIKLEKNLWNGYGIFEASNLKLTKFMVLQVLAAILVTLAFVWLGGRVRDGGAPKGKFANLLETMVVFVRDDIAQPAIGSREDTNKFLPFLLTMFFFVLAMNLLGMVPFFGASTGSIAVTGVLALITFAVVVGSGVIRYGPIGFLVNQVPHMDIPVAMAVVLKPMIFAIELFGILVKHFVLAVRLFANMLAGHLVLAVFVAFIHVTAQPDILGGNLVYGIAPLSILGSVALGCLEVLVAFLQAYVFTFLASLFIGSSLHPH